MRALPCSLLLAVLPAVGFCSSTSSMAKLTLLVSFDHPLSATSLENVQTQLHTVLRGTGLHVEVRDRETVPARTQFGQLIVFHMKGYCSMDPLPVGALSDERGPLAMAYSTDGQVLPFGEVECDSIRVCLERVLGKQSTRAYQPLFDAALGIVLAHEIYHILANSFEHTRKGVTKASLTGRELLDKNLSMPDIAQLAIRQTLSERH